jgi:hypothetical protein
VHSRDSSEINRVNFIKITSFRSSNPSALAGVDIIREITELIKSPPHKASEVAVMACVAEQLLKSVASPSSSTVLQTR